MQKVHKLRGVAFAPPSESHLPTAELPYLRMTLGFHAVAVTSASIARLLTTEVPPFTITAIGGKAGSRGSRTAKRGPNGSGSNPRQENAALVGLPPLPFPQPTERRPGDCILPSRSGWQAMVRRAWNG